MDAKQCDKKRRWDVGECPRVVRNIHANALLTAFNFHQTAIRTYIYIYNLYIHMHGCDERVCEHVINVKETRELRDRE